MEFQGFKIKLERGFPAENALERGQLNNYESYQKKLNHKVIVNDFFNIFKGKMVSLAESMPTL